MLPPPVSAAARLCSLVQECSWIHERTEAWMATRDTKHFGTFCLLRILPFISRNAFDAGALFRFIAVGLNLDTSADLLIRHMHKQNYMCERMRSSCSLLRILPFTSRNAFDAGALFRFIASGLSSDTSADLLVRHIHKQNYMCERIRSACYESLDSYRSFRETPSMRAPSFNS